MTIGQLWNPKVNSWDLVLLNSETGAWLRLPHPSCADSNHLAKWTWRWGRWWGWGRSCKSCIAQGCWLFTFLDFWLIPESPLEGAWQPTLQSRCLEYGPFATQMWWSLCFLAFGSFFCTHLFSSMDRVKGPTSRATLLPQALWCSWDWILVFSPYWPCFNLFALWLF